MISSNDTPRDRSTSCEQARRVTTLGDRPLMVPKANGSWPPTSAQRRASLARRAASVRGTQRMVDHKSHMIPIDAPEAGVTSIGDVVRAVRDVRRR